jgi:hypothetical protein
MPRFGTKTLLIAFALLALWLSTFSGFQAASDVRRSMLLLILVTSFFLAIYSQGKRRAYWSGFALVMLLCGGLNLQQPLNRYVPDFAWQRMLGMNIQPATLYPSPYYSGGSPNPIPVGSVQPQPPIVTYSAPVGYAPYTPAPSRSAAWAAMGESLAAVWTLGLSALSGFIAAFIFARTRPAASEASQRARQIVEQELQRG